MMFERFGEDADVAAAMGVDGARAGRRSTRRRSRLRRNQLLIFSRWCQVMFRFEKALYADPEPGPEPRCGGTWWRSTRRSAGPRAATRPTTPRKIHIVSAPAYYHNYMMGELFAAQVHHAIARRARGPTRPRRSTWASPRWAPS